MIQVAVIAAYASVRAGLRTLLHDADQIGIVEESEAGVILYDAGGDDDLARLITTVSARGAALVVLSDNRADAAQLAGCDLPGWALLLRDAEKGDLIGAIRAAAAGLIVLDRSLASLLIPGVTTPTIRNSEIPEESLTPREREVLQLMAQGLPNKIIAFRLGISLHTVKFHVASILAKLGAASRTEAVTLGARRGHVLL